VEASKRYLKGGQPKITALDAG